jgi:hypothetical protein
MPTQPNEGPDYPDRPGPPSVSALGKAVLAVGIVIMLMLTILLFFTDVIWSAGDDDPFGVGPLPLAL